MILAATRFALRVRGPMKKAEDVVEEDEGETDRPHESVGDRILGAGSQPSTVADKRKRGARVPPDAKKGGKARAEGAGQKRRGDRTEAARREASDGTVG